MKTALLAMAIFSLATLVYADPAWKDLTPVTRKLAPNDLGIGCRCQNCRSLWNPDGGLYGTASRVLATFVDKLPREVQKRWPDMTVIHSFPKATVDQMLALLNKAQREAAGDESPPISTFVLNTHTGSIDYETTPGSHRAPDWPLSSRHRANTHA